MRRISCTFVRHFHLRPSHVIAAACFFGLPCVRADEPDSAAAIDPLQLIACDRVATGDFFSSGPQTNGIVDTLGASELLPTQMEWRDDQITLQFIAPAHLPAEALYYRFRVDLSVPLPWMVDISVQAGTDSSALVEAHRERIVGARRLVARIPLCRFLPGQTGCIRIKGAGLLIERGDASRIEKEQWWLDLVRKTTPDAVYLDQLHRLRAYVLDAVHPSGLVRDALPISTSDVPIHPASPDAAGFAILGMCALHHVGLLADAAERVEAVLAAYAGRGPGVTPARSADGHWLHYMDITTGLNAGGRWERVFTPIGSALLVSAAQFARNHFIGNDRIAELATAVTQTTNFDAAIHPSVDGRVHLGMASTGGGDPTLGCTSPWNEFMLVVSLARRSANGHRAAAVAHRWLDAAKLPRISRGGVETLTDNPSSYAPAFWVQQMHFFNADFSTNPQFEALLRTHRMADKAYCSEELGEGYRYGLNAGVNPDGYYADRIADHHHVFSPETVAAWGDFDALLSFYREQSNSPYSGDGYGLVRVSSRRPAWVPSDAGLVDHLYLLFGLVERVEPLFFVQRSPGQPDLDADGIADLYDNRLGVFNPEQAN